MNIKYKMLNSSEIKASRSLRARRVSLRLESIESISSSELGKGERGGREFQTEGTACAKALWQ